MSNKRKLKDYIELEDIRKKLWMVDGKSRVSIMIGAGFSRNASKIDSSLKSMALWHDLRTKILDDLGEKEVYEKLDILSLGDIYENQFGVISLENLLKAEIPDENYEPNLLFSRLLSLPFSDIYTTNYDTLLERASKNVFTRQYQVIYDIHDIPGSVAPRIVKLHGSFPSHRPFIFSRESYELYPEESAPFVNMVQQSIMETTMILIGFSGDDPNFKKWIEWVTNSLGKHRPKMFMLGLDIDEESAPFSDNNIKMLDFKEIYSDSHNKYTIFFEDLFDFLSENPIIDQRKWPYKDYPWMGLSEQIDCNELISILKENRETYPGWLVMPSKIKQKQWMPKIINSYFELLEKENDLNSKIELTSEIVWLLKNFRVPIFYDQQKKLNTIVSQFEQVDLNENLVIVILFLIRECRIDSSKEYFDYVNLIDNIQLDNNQKNELIYQKILWEKDCVSKEEIKKKIDSWIIDNQSLDYLIKKACLLLKIDEIDEALLIIKNVLQTSRRIQSISSRNFFAYSVEGIILTLLQKYERKSLKDDYFNRLIELDQNFCSPSTTIEYVSNFKREKNAQFVERKRSYDGKVTVSYNMGGYENSGFVDSFFLMNLYDDYCMGIDDRHRLAILNSLYKSYPKYSQKRFFDFAKEKEIDEFFSKEQIYSLEQDQISMLYIFLRNELNSCSREKVTMLMDVLYRLYSVLDEKQRSELEEILIAWYTSEKKLKSIGIKSKEIFQKCFFRVLQTKYGRDLNLFCNRLYSLPMIGEKGTTIENVDMDENSTFDPISVASNSISDMVDITLVTGEYSLAKILNYLEDSKLAISVRLASWNRLLFLDITKSLSNSDYFLVKKVVKKMMRNNDKIFQNYLKSFAITSFVNEKKYTINYMETLIDADFSESFTEYGFSVGNSLNYQLDELRNLLISIEYTQDIYEKLIDKIGNWWNNQYIFAKKYIDSEVILPNQDLQDMIMFIKNSIFRQIKKKFFNEKMKKILLKCYSDLENDKDTRAILLAPGMLKIECGIDYSISNIKTAVLNSNKEIKENSIISIQDIAFFKLKGEIGLSVRELKVILLQLFAVQKESSLHDVSKIILLILRESKGFFTDKEKETISVNVDQFFSLYLLSDEQNDFDEDIFNEILKNYLDIIVEIRKGDFYINVQQWIEFCSRSKYSEISKYSFILNVRK